MPSGTGGRPKVATGRVRCARCGRLIPEGELFDLSHDRNKYSGPERWSWKGADAAAGHGLRGGENLERVARMQCVDVGRLTLSFNAMEAPPMTKALNKVDQQHLARRDPPSLFLIG